MAQAFIEIFIEQPIFRTYLFYVSVLGLKMLAMSTLTARQRYRNKAFVNQEDAELQKVKVKSHEDVERVRRAHLNDIENIPVFFAVCFVYLTTNPSALLATNLIRLFAIARFIHTFVYAIVVIPQPARGLSWGIGYAITTYMAVSSILYYMG